MPHGLLTHRDRGMVLVIVLWIIALLSVMAAGFAYSMRTETILAANEVGRAQARALAEAAVAYAALHVLSPDPAQRWPTDGSTREWRFGAGRVRVAVTEAGGRIDLNTADRELLGGLLASAGVEGKELDALLDAIEDWRDPDDLRHVNGAEADDYRAAGRAAGPKNAPFESVEELQQVLGMSAELYRKVAGALTVYSKQSGIDPAAAPPLVLKAVPGIDPGAVDEYVALRAQNVAQGLPAPPPPPQVGPYVSRSRGLVGLFQNQGIAYHVAVNADVDTGAIAFVEAVIKRGTRPDQPFQLLAWREDE